MFEGREVEGCIQQSLGFCLDRCGDEQMANRVEVRGMMKKKEVESKLCRASCREQVKSRSVG